MPLRLFTSSVSLECCEGCPDRCERALLIPIDELIFENELFFVSGLMELSSLEPVDRADIVRPFIGIGLSILEADAGRDDLRPSVGLGLDTNGRGFIPPIGIGLRETWRDTVLVCFPSFFSPSEFRFFSDHRQFISNKNCRFSINSIKNQ